MLLPVQFQCTESPLYISSYEICNFPLECQAKLGIFSNVLSSASPLPHTLQVKVMIISLLISPSSSVVSSFFLSPLPSPSGGTQKQNISDSSLLSSHKWMGCSSNGSFFSPPLKYHIFIRWFIIIFTLSHTFTSANGSVPY